MEKELVNAGKTLYQCLEFAKLQDDFYHKIKELTDDEEAMYQRAALHFLHILSEASANETREKTMDDFLEESEEKTTD